MTVGELRDLLSDYDENVEVRLMTQSNYPLQSYVFGVWQEDPSQDDDDEDGFKDEPLTAVYILEGEQVYDRPYGVKRAWDEAQR